MEFRYLSHFLYTDFYRGLMAGNIPHRCHNCGQYLLLTAGYNTCYCNNVAPGETERTCRKIGAHRKANHPQGLSPAGVEYRKVYNRLKARTQRRKISRDEWNAVVFQAQAVLELCDTIGSPWWKGITLYVSWKIRRLTAERECRRGELEELWPASEEEHCRRCLSCLRRLPPRLETAELESALPRSARPAAPDISAG